MDQRAGEAPVAPKRRRVGWVVGGAVLVAAAITAAVWFFLGTKVWTDGGAIRVADRDTKLREVLWQKPRPVDGFSSDEQVYEPSLSPDGTELYFVRGKAGRGAHIFVSLRKRNTWTNPEPVDAVNGEFDSLGPRLTPDGNYLLFYSDRPGGLGGYDVWAAPRTGNGWGEPFNLGPSVNSEFNEFNPDPTPDGKRLIFATNRKAAKREQNEAWRSTIRETVSSDYDLWLADTDRAPSSATQPTTQPNDGASNPPKLAFRPAREVVGINTPYTEGASCMSPAGDFLYFASNRPGGSGKFDIWRCRVHGDQFGPVENVGPSINSEENEADPALAFNGFRMYFSSDRPGADGRYQLLASDSREVYPERLGRPLPHLGWSAWLLIASVLILVPLLMFLRGWDEHRLSIIQKALLLSLLVHALLTFAMSFVVVTQNVTRYVRQEIGLEVAVNLKEAAGLEESLAIRSQVSGDLPTGAAEPATLGQSKVPDELAAAPATTDVDVPRARAALDAMSEAVEAPKASRVVSPSDPPKVDVAKATPADAIDVKLPVAAGVSQAEAQPRVTIARADLGKIATANSSSDVPRQVMAPTAAGVSAPPVGGVASPVARTGALAGAVSAQRPQVAAGASTGGDVVGPQINASKLAANEKTANPTDAPPGAVKSSAQAAASAGPAPAGAPVAQEVPMAQRTSGVSGIGAAQPQARVHDVVAAASGPIADDVAGAVGAPHVTLKSSGAQQAAAEPSLSNASLGQSPAAQRAPLQAAKDAGPAGAAPGNVRLPEGPVALTAKSIDLAAPRAEGPLGSRGREGTQLGLGPAPHADTGEAVSGPQISISGATAVRIRQAASEPEPVASSGMSGGPTTRPIQVASNSVGGAPAPENVRLPKGEEKLAPSGSAGSSVAAAAPSSTGKLLQTASAGSPVESPAGDTGRIAGPDLAGVTGSLKPAGKIATADDRAVTTDAVAAGPSRVTSSMVEAAPKLLDVASAPVKTGPAGSGGRSKGVRAIGPSLASAQLASADIAPQINLSPIGGSLGPGKLAMPDTPFMRAPEQRQPLLEKMGGTKQSEDAVALGLAYLARMQEADGRWTRVDDDRRRARRPHDRHDMACTGFALLAFLAQDHTPDKPGPYRDVVSKAVDYLVATQDDDGDLRGARQFRGGGSDSANMYDHGIATYALAESAIMTHDPRVIDAALKGATFIVNAQDANSGGWRYSPQEFGDSSVFGWQIMALHSAEQVGFEIPQQTLDGAKRYLQSCEEGKHGLLAGYQPHQGATPTMTAELLFCRMLLDMPLSEDGMREATRFLARQPPEANAADFYYWYYASLSMLHMSNPLWKDWNVLTREALVRMQEKEGPAAGSWSGDSRWAQRGGRVFSTAMATLTLEVYYRYLPLRRQADTRESDPKQDDAAVKRE